MPPLRDRREDIPLLVEHLRRQINRRWGCAVDGITPPAMARLEGHPWPGNVRELEGVLEQAMIFQGGGWISSELARQQLVVLAQLGQLRGVGGGRSTRYVLP